MSFFKHTVKLYAIPKRSYLGQMLRGLATGREAFRNDAERFQTALLVGRARDKRAVPTLLDLLRSADPVVVQSAALALEELGDPCAIQPLQRALETWEGRTPPFASTYVAKALRELDSIEES